MKRVNLIWRRDWPALFPLMEEVKSPKNEKKVQPSENAGKIQSPKNVEEIQSPKNEKKVQSPKNEKFDLLVSVRMNR